MTETPTLKIGDSNESVSIVKAILRSQGLWNGTDNTQFGPKLKNQIQYFQSTHLGPNKEYLSVDGVIGPATWWALRNPSGTEQRSNIVPVHTDDHASFYGDLLPSRKKQLQILFAEHKAGVHEVPDGSNCGDGVDKYIVGYGSVPWCCLSQSWVWKEAIGEYPLGHRQGHVQSFWYEALKCGKAHKKKDYKPVPGDLMVWHFGGGTGHISAIVATNESQDIFSTIGGNEGNRMKLGQRVLANESKCVGFINLHGDEKSPKHWTKTLLGGSSSGPFSESNTR